VPKRFHIKRVSAGQRGQVLVIAALSLFVLLLFVALAVDVGFWYGQRRHMQNAADSGALAGAWELCFGSRANATAAATAYAVFNGADGDMVHVDIVDADGTPDATNGNTVVVTAGVMARTFFARVLFPEVEVRAVAAANCAPTSAGCGLWPVAFDRISYDQISESIAHYEDPLDPNRLTGITHQPSSTFILWASDTVDWDPVHLEAHCEPPLAYKDSFVPFVGGTPMEPGNRGWVDLGLANPYKPPKGDPYADCSGNLSDCGAASLSCWLSHGFIGQLGWNVCLKGEPGVKSSALDAAQRKLNEPVSVLIFGPQGCPDPNDIAANCSQSTSGSLYYITKFGCVYVEEVFCPQCPTKELTLDHRNDDVHNAAFCQLDNKGNWDCEEDHKKNPCPSGAAIIVTKLNQCPPTTCPGDLPPGGDSPLSAVSLIPVPDAYAGH